MTMETLPRTLADVEPAGYGALLKTKAERQAELFRQGHDDTAPGAAIELGDDQAGDVDHLFEHLDLLDGVLAGGGVQHQ